MLIAGQLKVNNVATLDSSKSYFNLHQRSDILVEVDTGITLIPYYPDKKRKKYKRVKGIWAALRQQDHIIVESYGLGQKKLEGEIKEILDIISKLKIARAAVEKETSPSYNSPSRQTFNRFFHQLIRKIDELKQEARDKLFEAAKPLDSLNRRNPSAKMAQVTAAINRLEKRLLNILKIIKRIKYREQVILEDIILIRELLFESLRAVTINAKAKGLREIKQKMLRVYSCPYRKKILHIAEKLDDLIQNGILPYKITLIHYEIAELIYTFSEK